MQRFRLFVQVCFDLIDRDAYVLFDWIEGLRTLPVPVQPAVNLHSESLAFIFDNDFGVDTVNVNARFEGTKADKQRMIRLFSVLALNNTGRFLKFADAGKYLNGQFLRQGSSEEHTSELQSLMRITYAAFCLQKKTNHNYLCRHIDNDYT